MMSVKTAVIPVAGMGSGFLPATKAVPKELLPVVDMPAVEIVVREAHDAGIENVIFITSRDKSAISNHFDTHSKLEAALKKAGNLEGLEKVLQVTQLMNIAYVRQLRIMGIGDAILQARTFIGDQPFAVFFTDDLVRSSKPCIKQLIEVYEEKKCSVVGLEPVPMESIDHYGVIGGKRIDDHLYDVTEMIEKPDIDHAPSNLAIIGRYILTPQIFDILEKAKPAASGEIELTDALKELLKTQKIMGRVIEGKRYDIGDRLGFLKATVEYALDRPDVGQEFRKYLKELL
jgi:UTP--glucose-1-phosphate uridylyltransferase